MDPRRQPSTVQNSPPSLHRTFQRDDDIIPDDFYSSPLRRQRFPDEEVYQRRRRSGYDQRRSPSPPPLRRQRDTENYDGRRNSFSPERERSWSFRGASSAAKAHERSPVSVRTLGRPREGSLNNDGPFRVRNLSWVNPNNIKIKGSAEKVMSKLPLSSQISSLEDSTPAAPQERADFNGLKDVPKGPRRSETMISEFSSSFKTRPHILVQGDSLPADPDMIRHLEGFLRRYNPTSVHCEDHGYYVVFPDTPNGHRLLDECVAARDRSKFFGTYILRLEPFHHGLVAFEPPRISLNGSAQTPEQSDDPRLRHKTMKLAEPSTNVANSSPILHPSDPSALPTDRWRNSSPLLPPSRHSVDDASSLSGKTTLSDASSASKLKCHVCKIAQTTENDSLTRCSTCPRRYHRRCHASSAIPVAIEEQALWQCRRCIVKQVPRRKIPVINSELSESMPAAESTTTDPEERPAKRARLEGATDEPQTQQPDAVMQTEVDFVPTETSAEQSSTTTETHKTIATQDAHEAGTQASSLMMQDASQQVMEPRMDALPMDEADMLVEESFALPTSSANEPPKKISKLNLVRKKLERPAQEDTASATKAAQNAKSFNSTALQPTTSTKTASASTRGGIGTDEVVESALAPVSATSSAAPPEVPESPAAVRNTSIKSNEPTTQTTADLPSTKVAAQKSDDAGELSSNIAPPGRKAPRVDPLLPTAKRTKSEKAVVPCSICKRRTLQLKSIGRVLCNGCRAEQAKISDNRSLDSIVSAAESNEQTRESRAQHSAPQAALAGKARVEQKHASEDPALSKVVDKPSKSGSVQRELSPPANESVGDVLDFWKPTSGADASETSDHAVDLVKEKPDLAPSRHQPAPTSGIPHPEERADSITPEKSLQVTATHQTASKTSPPPEDTTQDISMASPGDDTPAKRTSSRRRRGRQADRPYTWDEYIRFAMIDSPGYRLQAKGICNWLLKNIPEGCSNQPLESRISMTLSAHDAMKGKRLWNRKKRQDSDRGAIGKGDWYVLQSHLIADQPRWDPVLKRAVSPFARTEDDISGEEGEFESEEDEDAPPIMPSRPGKLAAVGRAKTESSSKHTTSPTLQLPAVSTSSKAPAGHAAKSVKSSAPRREGSRGRIEHVQRSGGPSRLSTRHEPSEDTSEDEPLASRRSQVPQTSAPVAPMHTPAEDTLVDEDEVMIDAEMPEMSATAAKASDQSETSSVTHSALIRKPHLPTPESLRLKTNDRETTSLAERIRADAENMDYSAKSLFDEWPQHDPKNDIDKIAKLQEIRARPTRKQMFGKSTVYSRLGNNVATNTFSAPGSAVGGSFSANTSFDQRSNRSPQKQAYSGLPALEATVRKVATIEELFGAPMNAIPVMRGEKLCFRDGTLDKNGRLPRALAYYPTGCD